MDSTFGMAPPVYTQALAMPPYVPPFVLPPQPLTPYTTPPSTGAPMTTWILVSVVAFAAGALAMHYGMQYQKQKQRESFR